MATFQWALDAAGAAAGDEVTVTAGNAGTDGPTSVNSVAGGTRVFDNGQAPPGFSWSVRLAVGATSGTNNMVWGSTRIPNTAVGYWRIPIRFSEMLSNRSLARVRNGTTQILRVHRTADGRLEMRDSGNSVAATGTVSMPEDDWIEFGIFADPGVGSQCRLRWWQWGAAAEDFEDEIVATDDFSAAATVNELTIGNIAAGSSIPDYWIGPVRFSSDGWPAALSTVHSAASTEAGVGALTGAPTAVRPAATAMAGVGTFTAAAERHAADTTALAATGALDASAEHAHTAGAALPGVAALDVVAERIHVAAVTLGAAGELASSATATQPAGTTLSGAGALTGLASAAWAGAAPLAAAGALSPSTGVARPAAGSLAAVGGLTGQAAAARAGSVGLAGSTALAAVVTLTRAGAAVLSGTAALTAAGDVIAGGPVAPPDTGTVTRPSAGTIARPAAGTITRPAAGLILRPDAGTVTAP